MSDRFLYINWQRPCTVPCMQFIHSFIHSFIYAAKTFDRPPLDLQKHCQLWVLKSALEMQMFVDFVVKQEMPKKLTTVRTFGNICWSIKASHLIPIDFEILLESVKSFKFGCKNTRIL